MKTLFSSDKTKIVEVNGREMIVRVPAAAMLAIDTDGNVLMVKQTRGSFGKILEVPAGKVDAGESPMEAAMRELEEETGWRVLECEPLIQFYPSVGYTTEEIHCFLTKKMILKKQNLNECEDIEVLMIPITTIVEKIVAGEIKDSKTIMCIFSYLTRKLKDVQV